VCVCALVIICVFTSECVSVCANVCMACVDVCVCMYVGLARTIYIRCIYGIFGREITEYTVIHGVYIRFWPTLLVCLCAGPERAWRIL